MHGQDAYGPRDDGPGELPELPIARPGEWSPELGPRRKPKQGSGQEIKPPALGASFTSAATGSEPVRPRDEDDETPPHDLQLLTWELAARLTSGMLANPGRSHSSVKDAMGLFDQFLHEMHAYVRIASEYELIRDDSERRRSHSEYFRGTAEAADDAAAPMQQPSTGSTPTALPDRPRPTPPKPAPVLPRPGDDYRAIPPGARGPYTPGSMGGPPPPATDPDSDDTRRAA